MFNRINLSPFSNGKERVIDKNYYGYCNVRHLPDSSEEMSSPLAERAINVILPAHTENYIAQRASGSAFGNTSQLVTK